MTQKEIAKKHGVSTSYVCLVINGKKGCNNQALIEDLKKIRPSFTPKARMREVIQELKEENARLLELIQDQDHQEIEKYKISKMNEHLRHYNKRLNWSISVAYEFLLKQKISHASNVLEKALNIKEQEENQ